MNNTPVENYDGIFVKREDLCFQPPAPPFSKMRGLESYLKKVKKKGIKTVGYVESAISMAGIGVSYLSKKLKIKAIIFCPVYKTESDTSKYLSHHRKCWEKEGAEIIELPAGRTSVNYHIAKKIIVDIPDSVLLPIGLRFSEAVEETSKEVFCTDLSNIKTLVVYVGSGTICAGILKGVQDKKIKVIGITGSDVKKRKQLILKKAGLPEDGFFGPDFDLYNCDYSYTEKPNIKAPFPCHPYYDLKAWEWLLENRKKLSKPILFWNIGSDPFLEGK